MFFLYVVGVVLRVFSVFWMVCRIFLLSGLLVSVGDSMGGVVKVVFFVVVDCGIGKRMLLGVIVV